MQISCLRGTVTSPAQTHLSADYDAIPASLLFMWCVTVRFNIFVQSHNWELLQWVLSIVCEIFYLKYVSFITKFPLWKLALDISSPLIIQTEQLTLFKGNLNLCWRLAAMWLLLTIAILLYLLTNVHQIWQKIHLHLHFVMKRSRSLAKEIQKYEALFVRFSSKV